ncbi:hypothetical protein D3C78_1683720 [compost metagenome]
MTARAAAIATPRLSLCAGDALSDQAVHVGEGADAEAGLTFPIDQQDVQLRTGRNPQPQVQPFFRALLDIADDLHGLPLGVLCG